MLQSNRSWSLQTLDTRERLAYKLAHLTWTSCQAFQVDGYIFANDSTGPDGAQEYAILRPISDELQLVQIETVTFSWCSEIKSLELIVQACIGIFDATCLICSSDWRSTFSSPDHSRM